MTARPDILCVMRIPPFQHGHGGSQRAWFLVEALAKLGKVHFVLVHRNEDRDLESVSLEPLKGLVETLTTIPIASWSSIKSRFKWMPWRIARWIDPFVGRVGEAPRLSSVALTHIAAALPGKRFDLVFAGRLPSAFIVDQLIRRNLIETKRKVVDFDDVISLFRRRQTTANRRPLEDQLWDRLDIREVERAEDEICQWDAVSVCSDKDVSDLSAKKPRGKFMKVANVVDRPLLSPSGKEPRLLFVGNLSFPPNEHGLLRFAQQCWPEILARRPGTKMDVVGLRPSASLRAVLQASDITLHADVPSVEPYYRECAAIVCPIYFGGGTRIKLLEAMAYGRAIVSTSFGAEGLHLVSGEHALIADQPSDFADAAVRLLNDPTLAQELARHARSLQQSAYSLDVFNAAVAEMTLLAPIAPI